MSFAELHIVLESFCKIFADQALMCVWIISLCLDMIALTFIIEHILQLKNDLNPALGAGYF